MVWIDCRADISVIWRCILLIICIYISCIALRHLLFQTYHFMEYFNPLNPELNPICHLLALLGAHHFLHLSRIRVKLLIGLLLWRALVNAVMNLSVTLDGGNFLTS